MEDFHNNNHNNKENCELGNGDDINNRNIDTNAINNLNKENKKIINKIYGDNNLDFLKNSNTHALDLCYKRKRKEW